jgi:S1-C subfamily serine protease
MMNRVFGAIAMSAAVAIAQSIAAEGDAAAPTLMSPSPMPTLAPILKKITPAVVNVEIKGRYTTGTNPKRRAVREIHEVGSGVIYDAGKGYIITNNHVIDHANDITVTLTDGRMLKAKRVGADPDFDLAIIKVQADNLTSIAFGDSSQVEVGDVVLAIGYPMNIGQTVTSGIVGGLHRTNIGIEQNENFIQTDAAIYPGNSGGALVNLKGDLVGINTAFIGSSSTNPGMGFAIPTNTARAVANQILAYGDIRRGTLGITIEDPTPSVIRDMKLAGPQSGAVITKVDPGSAGERAGLKSGDVVTEIDGAMLRDAAFLRTRIALHRIGEVAELAVLREGKPIAIRATIADREPRSVAK